jgi:hypothetical protein
MGGLAPEVEHSLKNSAVSLVGCDDDDFGAAAKKTYALSLRHAVVAAPGSLILAADYSQLELRILAHLSDDRKLKGALNGGADVFKSVAASLFNESVTDVDEDQRQVAKQVRMYCPYISFYSEGKWFTKNLVHFDDGCSQICYGIIYGMGSKSLGEQLGIIEEEAAAFASEFKSSYSGVASWMERILGECRKRGYVTSMNGRKRSAHKGFCLPLSFLTLEAFNFLGICLTSRETQMSMSERQLNVKQSTRPSKVTLTCYQLSANHISCRIYPFCCIVRLFKLFLTGSAADLVKTAMNEIDRRLFAAFPHCQRPLAPSGDGEWKPRSARGAYFILQMHDELLYEVRNNIK